MPLTIIPVALVVGETTGRDELGGFLLYVGLAGPVALLFVLGIWRRYMARKLLDALVAGRPGLRHLDGEEEQHRAAAALASPAFDLGRFGGVGLVEPFRAVHVAHVLTGEARGLPFALAELRLVNADGYVVFAGVLGSFRLRRGCPGLTVVARDRGLLGNLVAGLGSGIGRVTLEDPVFERRFEAYGTDQVWARTVLTASMLERLLRIDELAHVRGFRCAFVGDHLLLAMPGLRWRASLFRLPFPLERWLPAYRGWLEQLIVTPAAVVEELALHEQAPDALPVPRLERRTSWTTIDDSNLVMRSQVWRVLGTLGMSAVWIASGSLFGGLALFFGHAILFEWGLEASGAKGLLLMTGIGVAYGAFAIGLGLRNFWRVARVWNAPLRGIGRV
jgi:hypothetical protein